MKRSFDRVAQAFLSEIQSEQQRKPSTLKRLRTSLSAARACFGNTPIKAIDAAAIEAFRNRRRDRDHMVESTVRHDIQTL